MTDRPLPEAVERAICRVESAYSLHSDFDRGPASAALRAAIAAAMAPGEPVAESVRDALAKVDVDYWVTEHGWRHTVLGLKEVEASHRAEVERAVAEEREACADACDRVQEKLECGGEEQDLAAAYVAKKCAAAIRARGGAK